VEYLFGRWKKIEDAVAGSVGAFLFLDYDGTLASIAKTPEMALLPKETRKILAELNSNPFFTLAIISGRSLEDIRKLVGIKGVIYAGNHGLQMKGPSLSYVNKEALRNRDLLSNIRRRLQNKVSGIEGVFVEDKGLTLSVHYRLASKKDIKPLKLILMRLLRPLIKDGKIRLTHGKMVCEIRPPAKWDKGRAVKWLLHKARLRRTTLPVCVGDDRTDEDMFKAVGPRGIAVCVGRPGSSSHAGFYLRNTGEVKKFLNKLKALKK